MQSSKIGMWGGHDLSIEGIRKDYFSVKNGIWKGKGLDLGAEPPHLKLCWVPPPSLYYEKENFYSAHAYAFAGPASICAHFVGGFS